MITFMSKNFINNKIIVPIGAAIKSTIVRKIKECIMFNVMINNVQELNVMDQLAIFIMYILHGGVRERLLNLVICHDSSGIGHISTC